MLTLVVVTVAARSAAADWFDAPTNAVLTGVVRDAAGKPIPWAAVWITGNQGGLTTYNFNSRGYTDADGRYRLTALVHSQETQILGMAVEARGFIQLDKAFGNSPLNLKPDEVTEAPPLTLDRGEVLDFTVDIPPKMSERLLGRVMDDRMYLVTVQRPGFRKTFFSMGDPHFEVYVPPGRYTIGLIEDETAKLTDVPAGSRGLRLTRTYKPVAADVLATAFDGLWSEMDRNYSYFELKRVDWTNLRDQYRPKAIEAGNAEQFGDVVAEMLGHLRDMHVRVLAPHDKMPTFVSPRPRDMNLVVVEKSLEKPVRCENLAFVGYTKADGFAALILNNQPSANKQNVAQVVRFIQGSHDAPGFIVDLRYAGGGSEPLAHEIARQFCAKDTVYATSMYRNGPDHAAFTRPYDRELKAVEKPYTKPVVCILGPGCVSSGEGFAQMMTCLPNVKTVGRPTRGSSGNPKEFKLPGVPVSVVYSRWVDMMPDGTPIEGRGVVPALRVEPGESAFENADPVWDTAIADLRQRAKESK
jgi:hypothetical protein